MKQTIFLCCIMTFFIAACSGQRIPADKVPSVVSNALKAKYPSSNDVDWKKNNAFYEAEIDINDSTEVSLRIDESGKILLQKQDIKDTELPVAVQNSIQQQYADHKIDDVERLEKDGITYYQVELDGKGTKDVYVVFTADGKEEKSISYWD